MQFGRDSEANPSPHQMKSQPPTSDRHRELPDWPIALVVFQGLLTTFAIPPWLTGTELRAIASSLVQN